MPTWTLTKETACLYVDIVCPLKCDKKIVKKNIDHHTTKECVKRDYVCPHCAFRAIYEIVSTIHWQECTYYPLQCPNRCGVTCERDNYHMKMCPLEEVECEFSHAGCKERFKREKEEEHMKENSQKHLTMMAAASLKMQNKLEEQERKFEEKLQEQLEKERKFEEKLQKQLEEGRRFEEKLQEQKEQTQTLLQEYELKLQLQKDRSKELQTEVDVLKRRCDDAERMLFENYKFTMENFSKEKEKDIINDWKSPPMYTHLCGYKFCIGIDANGHSTSARGQCECRAMAFEGGV